MRNIDLPTKSLIRVICTLVKSFKSINSQDCSLFLMLLLASYVLHNISMLKFEGCKRDLVRLVLCIFKQIISLVQKICAGALFIKSEVHFHSLMLQLHQLIRAVQSMTFRLTLFSCCHFVPKHRLKFFLKHARHFTAVKCTVKTC